MSERNHAAGSSDDLMASAERLPALKESLLHLPSWDLSPRQVCDLELLLNGAFAPLEGYLTRRDFEAVLADMRLANGRLCPLPVCLDVSETFAGSLRVGDRIALRHPGFSVGVGGVRKAALVYGNCLMGHLHRHEQHTCERLDRQTCYCIGCLCRVDLPYNRATIGTLMQENGWAYGLLSPSSRAVVWCARRVDGRWILPSEFRGG